MDLSTDLSAILSWYTGKAQAQVRDYVLPTLAAAREAGHWPPGASRRVRSLLHKQSVAVRFARKNERNDQRDGNAGLLEDVADVRGRMRYSAQISARPLVRAMQFGTFESAAGLVGLAERLASYCAYGAPGDAEQVALATADRWVTDFTPVAELVAQLDQTRPRPRYVVSQVSPTVFGNVSQAMGVQLLTVRVPEILWTPAQRTDDRGRVVEYLIAKILWPEGTRHDQSRFSRVDQCQACGHGIRTNNWVPLVGDVSGSTPASLWVGRDCARTLFGVRASAGVNRATGEAQ